MTVAYVTSLSELASRGGPEVIDNNDLFDQGRKTTQNAHAFEIRILNLDLNLNLLDNTQIVFLILVSLAKVKPTIGDWS